MAGDDVPRKKPDPIIYQLAAQRVGLPPDRFLTSFWPVFDQPLLDQQRLTGISRVFGPLDRRFTAFLTTFGAGRAESGQTAAPRRRAPGAARHTAGHQGSGGLRFGRAG